MDETRDAAMMIASAAARVTTGAAPGPMTGRRYIENLAASITKR
jgi:hypothetical protein